MIGLGFARPISAPSAARATSLGALMPSTQGALVWPTGRTLSTLVEDEQLPLRDNSVDRLLVVHCLEVAARPGPLSPRALARAEAGGAAS